MIVVVENVGAVVVHIGLRLSFAGMPQDVAMVKGGEQLPTGLLD